MSQDNVIKGIYNACTKSWLSEYPCVTTTFPSLLNRLERRDFIFEFIIQEVLPVIKSYLEKQGQLECKKYIVILDECCLATKELSSKTAFSLSRETEISNEIVTIVMQTSNYVHRENFTNQYCEIIKRK